MHFDADRSRSQSQLIMTPMTPPCPEVGTGVGVREASQRTLKSNGACPETVWGAHPGAAQGRESGVPGEHPLLKREGMLAASRVTRSQ